MLDGWSRLAIGGKSVDVFIPPTESRFALLYLHSLAEETPATDPTFTLALKQHGLRCLAPRGDRSWWGDRICPEFATDLTPERFLLDILAPWAETTWELNPHAIALAGVEMGGQGAVRLAFKHPQRFPIAASIAGAFDCQEWYGRGTPLDTQYDTRERCRQDTAILHIEGHDWPPHLWFCCSPTDAMSYRGNDRLHEKLAAMGVPHTLDLDTRTKPGVNYADQMTPPMVAFVAKSLEKEARRLM